MGLEWAIDGPHGYIVSVMKLRLGTLRRSIRTLFVENDDDVDMSDHLLGPDEGGAQGGAPDETIREHEDLVAEMREFFLQEGPAGAGAVDPRGAKGFYSDFDMTRDHGVGDDLSTSWYRSPGHAQGTSGDPYRSEDPQGQLGLKGTETDTQLAPQIWQLSAGGDTSKVLGANARPEPEPEEGSEEDNDEEEGEEGQQDPTGNGEAGEEGDEDQDAQDDDEAEGEESGGDDSQDRQDR